MPLPSAYSSRKRLHVRTTVFEGWQRDDGLVDIEARMTDVKDHDAMLGSGLRPQGEPIHDMKVRVTIDRQFMVVDVAASSDAVPYPGGCESIAPAYRQLIGLNLSKGFRRAVAERLGSVRGCSHMTELFAGLPTAAIQTFASLKKEIDVNSDKKPFQLDSCHALETSTETVRRYYPKWFRGAPLTTVASDEKVSSEV
jgi:Protein of unknown function (DUF2889)